MESMFYSDSMSADFPVITRYEVVGAEDVLRTNAELWASFKEGGLGVKEFSTALKENMEGTYAMRRAYSGMRMAIRTEWAPILETAAVLRGIGQIGRDVVQMWQAYTLGQMRVEQAQRNVVEATQDVASAQALYNQYLRAFGSESSYTKEALGKLEKAQSDLKDALRASAKAQQDNIAGYVGMALEGVGLISTLITMGVHLELLNAQLAASGGLLATIKGATAAGTVGGTLATALGIGAGAAVAGVAVEEYKHAKYAEVPTGLTPQGAVMYEFGTDVFKEQTRIGQKAKSVWDTLFGWIPHGQFGIPYTREGVIYAHEGERLLSQPEAVRYRDRGGLISAKVTMYNTITKMVDADAVAERAFRKLLEKLGNAW
jgi:hypothetical protein